MWNNILFHDRNLFRGYLYTLLLVVSVQTIMIIKSGAFKSLDMSITFYPDCFPIQSQIAPNVNANTLFLECPWFYPFNTREDVKRNMQLL